MLLIATGSQLRQRAWIACRERSPNLRSRTIEGSLAASPGGGYVPGMETKRVRGSRVVLVGFLIIVLITAFVLLRMMQSKSRGPVTSPPIPAAPADTTR
jgi:hypothetical protein